ncbi:MAG TPA: class I SAM-dependent methyltransferase [Flavisolibacter sp.]|jgi:ubiquinone/menaquinone biosynthesis C-methylase UbiE|nr:class I SAM-dependent methyltransferase [Flavisolibacter sp.]
MKRALFSGTIPEYYDKNLGPVLFEPYAKDLVHRIKSKPRHVLELACGTGRLTQQIINEIASVTEICAIDINRDMLLAAGSKIKSPLINWLISDAQDLVFEDERFDAVICQFGIMFFPNAQKAFDEAYRVLETGGSFLFNTWDNFESNPGSRIVHKVIKDYFKMTPEFMEKAPFHLMINC